MGWQEGTARSIITPELRALRASTGLIDSEFGGHQVGIPFIGRWRETKKRIEMYAVIESGGKQHRVEPGEVLKLEKLGASEGDTVDFDKVMMIGEGSDVKIGAPYVEGGKVTAEIVSHGRGDKVTIIKMRRRKHYRRQAGHRQSYTEVKIKEISGG